MANRRDVLKGMTLAVLAWPNSPPYGQSVSSPAFVLGEPRPFDFAVLKGMARALAQKPYHSSERPLPASLTEIDYDAYQAIRYRPERALWAEDALSFRVEFFHRGYHQKTRAAMYEVIGGQAREIRYDTSMFDFHKAGIDSRSLPGDLGLAGFRLHFHTRWDADVASSLG